MRDCKVMIANSPMDTDKVKIYGSKVKVDSVSKVAEIEAAEKKKMLDKVDRILAHGCNVFTNRQLIYNYPEEMFKANGPAVACEEACRPTLLVLTLTISHARRGVRAELLLLRHASTSEGVP